jgi:hypothetical protein
MYFHHRQVSPDFLKPENRLIHLFGHPFGKAVSEILDVSDHKGIPPDQKDQAGNRKGERSNQGIRKKEPIKY